MDSFFKVAKIALKPFGIKNRLDLRLMWRYKKYLFSTIGLLRESQSQFSQDVFVACELEILRNKRIGYFVEFGATDGIKLSNTYRLEKKYKWNGILSEPAKSWQESLKKNRKCNIDLRCVTEYSGEQIEFNEAIDSVYSSLEKYSYLDHHSQKRLAGKKYTVPSISLNDLLSSFKAPRDIDYLSIDTEGGEYEILRALNFAQWNIKIITVEHNFENKRSKIHQLLTSHGFRRVLENSTYVDDWYVKNRGSSE